MNLPKLTQIIFGLFFFVISLIAYILFIIQSFNRDFNNPPWIIILFGMLSVSLIHVGFSITKGGLEIRDEKLKKVSNGFWKFLAELTLWYKLFMLIIMIIIISALIIFIGYYSFSNSTLNLIIEPTKSTFFFLLGLPLYLLLAKIFSKTIYLHRKTMPTYKFNKENIIIDPKILGLKTQFLIRFSEIEELKELDFYEARSYLAKLGPNIPLAIKGVKSFYFLAKSKQRPKIYVLVQTSGKTLLIKGKGIFYLITFPTASLNDVIKAYKLYKSKQ